MDYRSLYDLWCEKVSDAELRADLEAMSESDEAIEDAFYRTLEFGTAGLRGVLGAGTNRMNIHTVGQATQGISSITLKIVSLVRLQFAMIRVLIQNYLPILLQVF